MVTVSDIGRQINAQDMDEGGVITLSTVNRHK